MSIRIAYFHGKPMDTPYPDACLARALAAIPGYAPLDVYDNMKDRPESEYADLCRAYEVILAGRHSPMIPAALSEDPGALRYVCSVVGSQRAYVHRSLLEAGVHLTNWGDTAGFPIAEGAFCLMLAALKDMHHQIAEIRRDGWTIDHKTTGGTLRNSTVGVYGCGAIGRTFIEMLQPFPCRVLVFDPYMKDVPPGAERVDSLEDLFRQSQIVAIHAGLTDETRHSVTAELLAMLPDHGVLVNTARGGIVDQDALFAELESGRLRAGVDVLDPDWLPPGHPAKLWENVVFTPHNINRGWPHPEPRTELVEAEKIALDNLRIYAETGTVPRAIPVEVFDRMT